MKNVVFFALVLAASALGCNGAGAAPATDGPGFVPSSGRPPSLTALVVENQSSDAITLVTAAPREVRLDHAVIEGAFEVPFPPELFAGERRQALEPHGVALAETEVEIVTSLGTTARKQAMMIGLDGGPRFFAIGSGRVLVRTRFDGSPVLEPEDPKTIAMLPMDRVIAECAAASLDAGYEVTTTSSAIGGVPAAVTSVTRDAGGCRVFAVEDGQDRRATVRVCIPDAAYPFADGDVLDFRLDNGSFDLGSTWLFTNAAGDTMRLVHSFIGDRLTDSIESLTIFARDDASCALVRDCGSVDVPAKLTYAFAGAAPRAVPVGAPIVDPANAARAYVVLGARARPIVSRTCASGAYESGDDYRAHAWLALIEKGKPRE